MRIIAGEYRGRRLLTPRGRILRPTSERAREALFNLLGERVIDATFLDICAGCGAVGLEALSRGAQCATFIERNMHCVRALRANIKACGCEDRAKVLIGDARKQLQQLLKSKEKFDIIFADPPYESTLATELLEWLSKRAQLLTANGWLIIQHASVNELPKMCGALNQLRVHRIGETSFSIYHRK
ncbi:MAG TPA: 16S rRNA (guanine(966)-N(2))-methyltransferase RsmD [Armatimonadetes bacterium]|nr:16S rRNA (guanine(966)-N(2))-methyltransferase RsmD [Armatimonadota bacterium]